MPIPSNPHPGPVDPLPPIFNGDGTVDVRAAIPGALVEVYVLLSDNGEPIAAGSAVADLLNPITAVGTGFKLKKDDQVFATQSIGGVESVLGGRVRVIEAPPFGPRPFYIIGHNTNTIEEVRSSLARGANALEPDLNVFSDDRDRICVSHSYGLEGDPTLEEYLRDLHTVVMQNPQLALVVFDCKEDVATPERGLEILQAIRTYLTFDNELNIIISVAKFAHGEIFDSIHTMLGPREGIVIDEEEDPNSVAGFFSDLGVIHQCYGNGISVMNSIISPYYRHTIERACELRARSNRPKFTYAWTVNDADEMREYIRIGVDAMITDDEAQLTGLAQEAEFASLIRLGNRGDNPFIPTNFAYGLAIHTGDVPMAGSDALLSFTLRGTLGTASKTVDADHIKRMEQDEWNFVTIPTPDLGDLLSITVQRDDDGNATDWFLDRILVRSFRFGSSRQAVFDCWIETTAPVTRLLE